MAENHALLGNMSIKTNALQDVKDMSKNLMNADFERQYGGAMVQKQRREQAWLVALTVAVSALVVSLLALTLVQELQLTRLRQELDDLTVSMNNLSTSVRVMQQEITDNKYKELMDTIDQDLDEFITPISDKDEEKGDSLEKLKGLTVLEDDSMGDDEDLLDLDDEESGDWYSDYDRRREKVGTSNMVRLKPEDFLGPVLTLSRDGKTAPVSRSDIQDLSRRLNHNPENPDLPALPTLSLPTELDTSDEESSLPARDRRSVFPDSVDEFAAPKISKADERRKTKKFIPTTEPESSTKMHIVTRTIRNSDTAEEQRRPFIAAHFHGNTSHLNTETHDHYKGNGLVRVSHGAAHDVWYPSPWTMASPHPRPTLTRNGHVHVHHTGVYLVYVQIYYLDSHDVISWVLHRTNADIEGRETILQCAQSSHSSEPQEKPNSCFSASALFLKAGDRLAVRNTGGDRHALMQPEKSFIGLIKLADAEDPTQEF